MKTFNEFWLNERARDVKDFKREVSKATPTGAKKQSPGLIGTTERTPVERQAPKPEWDKGTGTGYPKPKPKPTAKLRPDPGAKGVTPKSTPKSAPVAKPYQGGNAASKARPVGPTPNKPTPVNQVELNKKKIADKKKADTLSGSKTGSRLGGTRQTISSTSRPANTMSRPQNRTHSTSTPTQTKTPTNTSTPKSNKYASADEIRDRKFQDYKSDRAERKSRQDALDKKNKAAEDKKKGKEFRDFVNKKYDQTKKAIETSAEDRTKVAGPSGDVSGGSQYQSRSQRS